MTTYNEQIKTYGDQRAEAWLTAMKAREVGCEALKALALREYVDAADMILQLKNSRDMPLLMHIKE